MPRERRLPESLTTARPELKGDADREDGKKRYVGGARPRERAKRVVMVSLR